MRDHTIYTLVGENLTADTVGDVNQPSLFDQLPSEADAGPDANIGGVTNGTSVLPGEPTGEESDTAPRNAAGETRAWEGNYTVLVVDGNSLLHRAYHAYQQSGLTGSDGRPTYAVYGFLALFAGIADKVGPDAVIVAFDSRRSVRKERWAHYKATRSSAAEDLYQQMDEVKEILTQIGVTVTTAEGWEADDVVTSVAATATAAGKHTVIATSDRDSFAQISDTVTVLRLGSGLDNAIAMTPERLYADYGVHPHQYLSYAALRGDPSDNLPGVRGIGPKTAVKLLAETDVPDAVADQERTAAIIGKSAAAKLVAGIENWELNCEIMRTKTDLDIDLGTAHLEIEAETVRTVLTQAGQPTVIARLSAALGATREQADDADIIFVLTDDDEPF